jgi:hypothetical protein
MFIVLFDRGDRLGANLTTYITSILYAHKNSYIIKFKDNLKESYRYYNSIFVKILFNYIDKHNEVMYRKNIKDDIEVSFNSTDFLYTVGKTLYEIESDYLSYFYKNIHYNIRKDLLNINKNLYNIPFDINKTILVHLRLDDTQLHKWIDYDGRICSNHYKLKIQNKECLEHYTPINCNNACCENYNGAANMQSPLAKEKIVNIINKAKNEHQDYKVIFLTSPMSDTSFLNDLNYEVIKNEDESVELLFYQGVHTLSLHCFLVCQLTTMVY